MKGEIHLQRLTNDHARIDGERHELSDLQSSTIIKIPTLLVHSEFGYKSSFI